MQNLKVGLLNRLKVVTDEIERLEGEQQPEPEPEPELEPELERAGCT